MIFLLLGVVCSRAQNATDCVAPLVMVDDGCDCAAPLVLVDNACVSRDSIQHEADNVESLAAWNNVVDSNPAYWCVRAMGRAMFAAFVFLKFGNTHTPLRPASPLQEAERVSGLAKRSLGNYRNWNES